MGLQVRRGEHLVHDTLLQVQNAGSAIRRPLKVQFIGEEGVDEGGVQKVQSLCTPCLLSM
jgi:ubiquitin-protein ligase E3 A